MKKAQLALEFLFVLIIALSIMGPLFFFTFSLSNDNIKISEAQSAVDTIGHNVNYVYSLNKGSVTSFEVLVPEGITGYNLTGKTIIYNLVISSGNNSIFYTTKANVTGILPATEGRHTITLNNTGAGVVIG